MASVRTISTDIWIDEDFAYLSLMERLTYLGLMAHADEHGYVQAHTRLLLNLIFPADSYEDSKMEKSLQCLEGCRLISFEVREGKRYVRVLKYFEYEHGYVYLACHGELHKIGYSVEPGRRMKQLKRELGFACKILFTIETPHYRQLEAELHQRFFDKRVRGEWFNLDTGDLEWFATFVSEQEEALNG